MTKLSRSLSVIIIIILCLTASNITSFATRPPTYFGDVDLDGAVTIKDATLVQKCVASIEELNILQSFTADVDSDKHITVKDATAIQKHSAGLITLSSFQSDFEYIDIISNYDSGKAMVGVEVTFNVKTVNYSYMEPIFYDYYINDDLVAEASDSNAFNYTFDLSGRYFVKTVVHSAIGTDAQATKYLVVVDEYPITSPEILAVYTSPNIVSILDLDQVTIYANAVSDASPCEYKFELKESGVVLSDFSQKSTCKLHSISELGENTIIVTARDTLGRTATAEYVIYVGI